MPRRYPYQHRDDEKDMFQVLSRNVLLQCARPGTTHALVSYTGLVLTVHYGNFNRTFQPAGQQSFYLHENPALAALNAGAGWNLTELVYLLGEKNDC